MTNIHLPKIFLCFAWKADFWRSDNEVYKNCLLSYMKIGAEVFYMQRLVSYYRETLNSWEFTSFLLHSTFPWIIWQLLKVTFWKELVLKLRKTYFNELKIKRWFPQCPKSEHQKTFCCYLKTEYLPISSSLLPADVTLD